MRILVADDDAVTVALLDHCLKEWGFQVIPCRDGGEAWRVLDSDDPPRLILLDWVMPEIDGITICRRIRDLHREAYFYIILVTQRDSKEDLLEGLSAGADDYIVKPFDKNELRARISAGRRVVELQAALVAANARFETRNRELKEVLDKVKKFSGLLPICASCKKIRDDKGCWTEIESYILDHSEADFSHGLCPECALRLYGHRGSEDELM